MPQARRSRISSDHSSLQSTSSHNGITTTSITGKVTSSGRSSVSTPNTPPPIEIPNVPSRDINLRRALGNAIVQASTGMAAVSIDTKKVARIPNISDRPDTAVSGLSVSAIPLTMKTKNVLHKASTLPCSSSEDDDSTGHDHILRNASSNSLPATTPTLYESTKLALETDPNIHREIALGKLVGFYKLGKELGCGNFSKVKLGIHTLTKEKVAVKVMDKSKMDLKASRLLAREIASMEHLHHPNVIRLFEVIETLSKVFLVMEYAGGGELYTYVHENGKLMEEAAKPIFAQLISAVGHLHAKGVVHRDIKAENVIFAQPGWVKLADFGFSCRYADDPLNTFCGSPPYAAPELFRDADYNGPMVDMWALGVTLYFMLVGVTPFRGDTISMLKTNIMSNNYSMPDYLSGFAQFVIQRCLNQDPTKRATAHDIRKMYWLSQSKFPESYLQISVTPNESSLETDEMERRVWAKLAEIGITTTMIRDSVDKGARDCIIGTYRIVMFQAQAPDHERELLKVRDHVYRMNQRNKRAEEQFNQRSKTCTLF